MLQSTSKAARLVPQLQHSALPAAACALTRLQLSAAAQLPHVSHRGFAGGRHTGDDREEAAARAAQELAAAAQDSVKHAAQGDLGAVAQDAARMAQAGARGAAESARLVLEKLTGLNTTSGYEGAGSHAPPGSSSSAVSGVAASAADAASAVYSQTVGSMTGTSVPQGGLKGPESTYSENVLRGSGVHGMADATGDWAGVMVQSAADEAGTGGGSGADGGAVGGEDLAASAKGSGAGGQGFAGPPGGAGAGPGAGGRSATSEKAFSVDEFVLDDSGLAGAPEGSTRGAYPAGGGGEGGEAGELGSHLETGLRGGGGGGSGGPSEQATADDEFGVSQGEPQKP